MIMVWVDHAGKRRVKIVNNHAGNSRAAHVMFMSCGHFCRYEAQGGTEIDRCCECTSHPYGPCSLVLAAEGRTYWERKK